MEILSELKRVMKPGGLIVISVIDKEGIKKTKITQSGIYSLYNGEDLVGLLTKAGFGQVRFEAKAVHKFGMGICAIAEK